MGRSRRLRPKHLSRKLKQIRLKFGYTRLQMARALGLRYPGYISGFENGKREPSLIVLLNYAKLAGCCTCYLADDSAEITIHKTVRESLMRSRKGKR